MRGGEMKEVMEWRGKRWKGSKREDREEEQRAKQRVEGENYRKKWM